MVSLVTTARGLRAFGDGFVAVLLPAYLLALGQGQLEVGFVSTGSLFGSAIATLAVGRWGHRFELRRMLLAAAVLMTATGPAVLNQLLFKSVPYDTDRDFAPVILVGELPQVIVAGPQFKTLKDLIDYGRANPGKLNIGHAGAG